MAVIKEGNKPQKPGFLTEAQFAELMTSLSGAGGSIVAEGFLFEERSSPRSTKEGEPSLNDLVQAVFEQLGFLRQDTIEVHHQIAKLFGYGPENGEKINGGDSPMPDDLRTKLKCLLAFVGEIRGMQTYNVSRLAQGI